MGGIGSLLVGLNNGETNWNSVGTIAPLVIGAACIVAGLINEVYTKQSPVIPPRLFHTRTTAAILAITFFHGTAFFMGAYFIPLYFQILGNSALMAGVRGLPYSLAISLTAIVGGISLTNLFRNARILMAANLALATLGVSSGLFFQVTCEG